MSSTSRITSEVILCPKCKGKGVIEHSELTCYHKGEYDYWNTLCTTCEGSGRVTQKIETITTLTPFTTTPDVKS